MVISDLGGILYPYDVPTQPGDFCVTLGQCYCLSTKKLYQGIEVLVEMCYNKYGIYISAFHKHIDRCCKIIT